MRGKLRQVAALMAFGALVACSNGSGGTETVDLQSKDVGDLSNNIGTTSMLTVTGTEEALANEGSTTLASGDACYDTTFTRDGDSFTLDITMSGCQFVDDAYGTVTADGSLHMQGTYNPSTKKVTNLSDQCSPYIPDLDTLLSGLGNSLVWMKMDGAYSITDAQDQPLVELQDGSWELVTFSQGILFAAGFKIPYQTSVGIEVDAVVSAHVLFEIDLSGNTQDPDITKTYGVVTIELYRKSSDLKLETMTITADGTSTMTFTLSNANRSGTIDMDTGEVTWNN